MFLCLTFQVALNGVIHPSISLLPTSGQCVMCHLQDGPMHQRHGEHSDDVRRANQTEDRASSRGFAIVPGWAVVALFCTMLGPLVQEVAHAHTYTHCPHDSLLCLAARVHTANSPPITSRNVSMPPRRPPTLSGQGPGAAETWLGRHRTAPLRLCLPGSPRFHVRGPPGRCRHPTSQSRPCRRWYPAYALPSAIPGAPPGPCL
jgi:hypothetical protein